MNGKTFVISLVLGVGTAVLSAYFVKKMTEPTPPTNAKH
jgi:hypothetical protein